MIIYCWTKLHIGTSEHIVSVGTYFVAVEDLTRGVKWRTETLYPEVEKPNGNELLYPEKWRIPVDATKPQKLALKTVCRILTLDLNHTATWTGRREALSAVDVHIRAQVFVRPEDIGVNHHCPFEVIETDLGMLCCCNTCNSI